MSEHISPIDAERHQAESRREPEPMQANTDAVAGTPEAVKEAAVSRKAVSGKAARDRLAQVRGRGVDWVRPTDLLAQGGGALSRRGIDFTAQTNRRTRAGIGKGARWVAERASRLPPLNAFGRRGGRRSGPAAFRGRDEVAGW